MRFDDSWPKDPRLDPFRDTVWELRRKGKVEGYLTCRVIPMRSFPNPWAKNEWLWYQVHWLNGQGERPQTDHGPSWSTVAELESGRFTPDDIRGFVFDAGRVEGAERDRLWKQYGPQG